MAIPSEAEVEADTRDYYRARAPEFEQWILREGRYAHGPEADAAWHREMAELQQFAGSLTDASVFEVASGTGWWTRLLAARNRVIATDYAPEMLDEARRRDEDHLPLGRCRADAYRLPAGDDSVDACMFGFWLSHVPIARSAEFIREAARIVRPGGQDRAGGLEAGGTLRRVRPVRQGRPRATAAPAPQRRPRIHDLEDLLVARRAALPAGPRLHRGRSHPDRQLLHRRPRPGDSENSRLGKQLNHQGRGGKEH